MERIFRRGRKTPEEDIGPFELGYMLRIYFVEDMGKNINKILPEKYRRTRISVSGGGMSLAKATEKRVQVQGEWGTQITSKDGQDGWYKVVIEPEIPPDDIRRF